MTHSTRLRTGVPLRTPFMTLPLAAIVIAAVVVGSQLTGGSRAAISADINGDGTVGILDLSALLSAWNATTGRADLNADGRVNVLDLSALLSAWGQKLATPTTAPSATPTAKASASPTPVATGTSVESFGAKGDGATDDTAAIQKALDAATPASPVIIAAGKTYRHAGVIFIRVAGIKMTGGGTLLGTSEGSSAVTIKSENVTVENLTLRTTGVTHRWGAPDQNGLNIDQVSGAVVRNVTIDGSAAAGMFALGASNYLIEDVTVQNTWADAFHNTFGSRDGVIRRPIIRNAGDDGVAIVSYGQDGKICQNIQVISPKFYGSHNGRAYSVVGGQNVTFTDVYAENSDGAGVYIGTEGDPYNTFATSDITVDGGTLVRSNQGSVDHGAVLLLSGRSGYVQNGITVKNLAIKDTRATTSRQVGLISYNGGGFNKVLLQNLTLTGGGTPYQGNYDGKGYNRINWTYNGAKLPDLINY